jgi:2-keto-4-pentenoate hydratase/2-oxohepta-3-ene-1,7-dioic acid hydratase in catechol pathway
LNDGPGDARLGAVSGDRMLDLATLAASTGAGAFPASVRQLLEGGADALEAAAGLVARAGSDAGHPLSDVRFLPPIDVTNKILCVGKNYRTHLEELKRTDLIRELPEEPTGFIKLHQCLTGHDTEIVRPPTVTRLDYEPELVFVIGKPAYQVSAADAWDHVAGITLLNDLTCRDTQKREVASGSRFWTAKNAPGFGPLGPCIVTMDEVPDPYDLWVTCSVNGEQRMRVNTSD